MKKIISWVLDRIADIKRKRRFKKKLKDLRKRDPFIYNH